MESKKDIGNYFKENLEQLDYSPSNKVWDGIEVELNQKKKKRGFGFWLFFALIAISGALTYAYFSNSDSGKPKTNSVVTTDATKSKGNNSTKADSSSNNTSSNSTDSNPNSENSNSGSSDLNNPNAVNAFIKGNNSAADANNKLGDNNLNGKSNSGKIKRSGKIENSNKKGISGKVANSNTIGNSNKKTKKNTVGKFNSNDTVSGIANEKDSKNYLLKKLSKKSKNKKTDIPTVSDGNENSLALAGKKSKKGKNSTTSAIDTNKSDDAAKENNPNLDTLKTSENSTASTSEKKSDKKLSAEELRKAKKLNLEELKKENLKKRDSIAAVKKLDKEKKALTDQPKDEEEKDSTPTKLAEKNHGLIIAPYYGLNYTGNFGNGNFLNESKTSKKTGDFSSSYGFLLRLMGNKKIGVQFGVGMINSVYSATFTKESNNFITENDVKLINNISLQELNETFPNETKITSRQETSFMEVPVEVYYIFSDKKFGMATAFGVSFLSFQQNDLYLESDEVSRMKIGSLQTISPFSWALNVKLNLFYKITPKLNFDLYPSFQYQFMGYKDANDYQPYFFSIKTGLSYKL